MQSGTSIDRPMTLRRTVSDIRSDYVRLATTLGVRLSVARVFFSAISPPIMALTLYRVSRYFYCAGLRPVAWLVYTFNCYLTGADIAPSTNIGRSCLIGHANGVTLACRIGDNVTIYGRAGVGGGRRSGDIGGGPGLPVVEDDVMIGWGASVLGAIRIGRGATIGAHTLVMDDVPAGASVVSSARAVILGKRGEAKGETAGDTDIAPVHHA